MKTLLSINLTLRPARLDDIPELSRMLGNPETTRYLFSGKPASLERAEEFIEKHFSTVEDADIGMGTVMESATERFAGLAGLIRSAYPGGNDLELGFGIVKAAQGNRHGNEIGKRQIVFGFDELNCDRLLALTHPPNEYSCHISKKILR